MDSGPSETTKKDNEEHKSQPKGGIKKVISEQTIS